MTPTEAVFGSLDGVVYGDSLGLWGAEAVREGLLIAFGRESQGLAIPG